MVDLSQVPDADLQAYQAGNYGAISNGGLQILNQLHADSPQSAPETDSPSFSQSVGQDLQKRIQMGNKIVSSDEPTYEKVPQYVGKVGAGLANDIIGDAIPQPVKDAMGAVNSGIQDVMPDSYKKAWSTTLQPAVNAYNNASPETKNNVDAAGDFLGLATNLSAGKNLASGMRSGINAASDYSANVPSLLGSKLPVPATAADLDTIKNKSYADMRANNETFPQQNFSDPISSKIDSLMPQPVTANGVLGSNQQALANNLTKIRSMISNQDISGVGVDTLGRELNDMLQNPENINQTTGELNSNGRAIAQVRGAVQDILNNDHTTGSVSGYNGRVAASTQFSLSPIEDALRNGDLVNTAETYRAQAAKLFKDDDYTRNLDPDSLDLLKTAATRSLGDKLTSPIAAHLLASTAGSAAGFVFGPEAAAGTFGGIEAAKVGLDAVKANLKRAQLTDFRQSVIDNGMGRLKPVPPPAPPIPKTPPLQITGPGASMYADAMGNVSRTPNPANEIVNTQPSPIVSKTLNTPYPSTPSQVLLPSPENMTPLPSQTKYAAAMGNAARGNEGMLPSDTIPTYPRNRTMPGQPGNMGAKTLSQVKALAMQGKTPAEIADYLQRMGK